MKFLQRPMLALLMLALVSGCRMTESPTTSSADQLKGTLKGRLLFGSNDNADLPLPPGSATISMEGTSISTTSDDQGHWTFNDLPTGTYNISITRPGFAPRREIGFQFVGGGVAYLPAPLSLWKQTLVTVSDLEVVLVDTNREGRLQPSLYVSGTLNAPSTHQHPSGLLIIGQSDSLAINNRGAASFRTAVYSRPEDGGAPGFFETWITLSDLRGFVSGSTTRVLAYGWEPQGMYYDPERGMEFIPNYSTPDLATFVMP